MASIDDKSKRREASPASSKELGSPHNVMATIEDDDERLLAQIGYNQVRMHNLPNITHAH